MKHLYWTHTAEGLVFASEAQALFVSGFVRAEPDWNALGSYFSIGWFPSPVTAFQGVQRLRPGSYLHLTDDDVEEKRYWIPLSETGTGSQRAGLCV